MKKGFTLLEILLVIAAIGILAAIVIVAINPNRQLAQARDAERSSEVRSIYQALEQYSIDNNGAYPGNLTSGYQPLCSTAGGTGCVDIVGDLVPTYLSSVPQDPSVSGDSSGYAVSLTSSGLGFSIVAPEFESAPQVLGATLYPVDQFTTPRAAYGLRRLSGSYSGSLVRIRRDSDDLEQDVGFVQDILDVDGVNTFCSGANCFVTTWYDQSGESNDATEATNAQQPKIYDTTTGLIRDELGNLAIEFDGIDDEMTSTNSYTSVNEEVNMIFADPDVYPSVGYFTFVGSRTNSAYTMRYFQDGGFDRPVSGFTNGVDSLRRGSTGAAIGTNPFAFVTAYSNVENEIYFMKNASLSGSVQTFSASGGVRYGIGSRGGGLSELFDGTMTEIIMAHEYFGDETPETQNFFYSLTEDYVINP